MALDIDEIRVNYNNGVYTYKVDIPKKVKLDHVFDEELSVKRNREMVAEHNQKVEELRTLKRQQQNELNKQLTNDVVEYIKENYDLNDKQARIVESWVYREQHSCMCDYFSYIDILAEFADDLINRAE